VQTLDDGEALIAELDSGRVERVVVVGGGYIGLELAEACQVRRLDVTVVDRSPTPIGTFDPDIGRFIAEAVAELGIRLVLGQPAARVETGPDGRAVAVHTADGQRLAAGPGDPGLGVRPNVALAQAAGIPLGPSGGVAVDNRMRTQVDGVWSAGDCVESRHRLSGQRAVVALGTHANKQGRVVGINLGGGYATFPVSSGQRSPRCATWRWRAPGCPRRRPSRPATATSPRTSTPPPGRLLPGRQADPREAAGREAQRPPARRADRRP
jgi:NADPH-dependent 2,4-dienoyl-CoA reductase/sulfur reductase-like enzyme